MSRTPYARRKPKKEELEELQVIRGPEVPVPDELVPRGEPSKSGLIVPDDASDIDLRLQGTPEKKLSLETVEHKGIDEVLAHIVNTPRELPVVHAVQPKALEQQKESTVTPTKIGTTDHIKLGEGDTTLWREAVRPQKKADEQ